MTKLTSYQTHKLIKQAIPEAKTVYEEENPQHQITIEEWLDSEKELEQANPELFNCFFANIKKGAKK